MRDEGVTVSSGFHLAVEQECLRILLGGRQRLVICLAGAIDKIRLPTDWRQPFDAGRLLLVSPFENRPRRPTVEAAHQRNPLAAALADDALIIHAEPNGSVARIAGLLALWKVPPRSLP